jgi:hypothetical protein
MSRILTITISALLLAGCADASHKFAANQCPANVGGSRLGGLRCEGSYWTNQPVVDPIANQNGGQ